VQLAGPEKSILPDVFTENGPVGQRVRVRTALSLTHQFPPVRGFRLFSVWVLTVFPASLTQPAAAARYGSATAELCWVG